MLIAKSIFRAVLIGSSLLLLAACAKDEDNTDDPITVFDDGIFICNQSSEISANGAISYYDRSRNQVANDIFLTKNSVPLTGEVYSIHVFNSKAYIVLENSGKIEVVDAVSMELLATIEDLDLPHYFLPVNNNKAYVSQWGADGVSGSIKVVDLNTNMVVNTILTKGGPEQMLKRGNDVYVAITGGYLLDSVVSVVNTITDQISDDINVGVVPQSLQLDKNSNIWVLCRGLIDLQNPDNSIDGQLVRLNNNQVALSVPIAAGASDLVINNSGDKLYFLNPQSTSWVYEHPIESTTLSSVPLTDFPISHLGYDDDADLLIGSDIKNGQVNGDFILLDAAGKEAERFEVGLRPSEFWAN